MSAKPKLLLVGDLSNQDGQFLSQLRDQYDVINVQSPLRALAWLSRETFDGVYVLSPHVDGALQLGSLLQNERVLEAMPDGVVLLDADNTIIWANERFREWTGRDNPTGMNFYSALGSPEILGPDYCPFHTVLATGQPSGSTLRTAENSFFHVHAAIASTDDDEGGQLIVSVRDVSTEILQQQKLAAIHRAGVELADLSPDELSEMSVSERIDLLKSNIVHYTKDLLQFDVVEIRLLDQKTRELRPLLCEGLKPEATGRELFARVQDNGVTGFVASTGKSCLCEDTSKDPLYIEGCQDAKSSLTVPLVLHDEVIGTFNVESPEPRAFSDSDLQFLEVFGRDVAGALNTLELLQAEQAIVAAESVEAIHSAVALPIDEILNDAVNVMERYIGHKSEVTEHLQRILQNARDIKQVIQKVGRKMRPGQAHPKAMNVEQRPLLSNRRVLVVDADDSVRSAAHALLERYGCVVETAHDGDEAIHMVRNTGAQGPYDVMIADIRLPDYSGYQLFLRLSELIDPVPLVLMTGFGYDPGHSIVKARQAGLKEVLYKPFRLDQLLETVERVLKTPGPVQQA